MAQSNEKKGYYTRERIVFISLTAVIGIGLVIPFGMGSFVQRPEAKEAGRIAGDPVTAGELEAFRPRAELVAALDEIGHNPRLGGMRGQWLRFLPYILNNKRDREEAGGREDRAWEWLAYLRAAERAGIRIRPQQVSEFVIDISGGPAGFKLDSYVTLVQAGFGLPIETFEQAVSDHLAVSAYFKAIGDGAVVTAQELLDAYREQNREVEAAYLGFKSDANASAVKPPSRDAVYRAFEARKDTYAIPAKAQVEYLLAAREALVGSTDPSGEEEIVKWYRDRRDTEFRKPEPVAPGTEPWKPLEEVRESIVKTLRQNAAGRRAFERMQKALFEDIGGYEDRAREDPLATLDLKAVAAARGVAQGVTRFFSDEEIDEIEKDLGAFSSPQDREVFRRRVFETMKAGDVMPGQNTPVATSKGYVIYRLASRKPRRVPEQLTAEVEAAVVRDLRRNAMESFARTEAQGLVDLVNAKGLEKAEAESGKKLLRAPRTKPGRAFPDPAGGAGHIHGGNIVERAFEMHKANQAGKATLLPASGRGDDQPVYYYAVVLLQHHEATMDNFPLEKDWIKEQLLESRSDPMTMMPIPGKRQLLIDAERAKLRQGIEKAKPEPGSGPA